MSYPAPSERERSAIDALPPVPCDPVLARMVADLRSNGRLEICTPDGIVTPEIVERTRQLLMNELCEPVTATRIADGLLFVREWGEQRRRA